MPSTDDADRKRSVLVSDEEEQAATVTWDAETERRLRWKCDRHVLPCITLLFFLSFLDRTNIGECLVLSARLWTSATSTRLETSSAGSLTTRLLYSDLGNAKIQGMIEDLDMTGHDYNIALFVFFPPYILFEVPSNIIIKKVAPSTWLSVIMVLWGESDAEDAPLPRAGCSMGSMGNSKDWT